MIPMIPVSGKRDALKTGTLGFNGILPVMTDSIDLREGLIEAHSKTQADDEMIILDVDGFSSRFLNNEIIKSVRVKGRDLCLITYIENVDDIISALTGSFGSIGVPLHTIDDEDVLLDGMDFSDSLIPVAFTSMGKVIGSNESLERIEKRMEILGFDRMIAMDMERITAESIQLKPSTYSAI